MEEQQKTTPTTIEVEKATSAPDIKNTNAYKKSK